MKLFIATIALVALCHAVPEDAVSSSLMASVMQAKWSNFKTTHKKEYGCNEDKVRMAKFLERTVDIEQHNEKFAKGEVSYERAHTEFSDMHKDELKCKCGFRAPPPPACPNATQGLALSSVGAPPSFDWRTKNGVTPVRDQGNCGSCYSFAAIGAIEGAYAVKFGQQLDLSEQDAVDCSPQDNGCGGGFPYNTLNYFKQGGPKMENVYPYRAVRQGCRQTASTFNAAIRQVVMLQKGDEEGMKNALATYGPISVGFQVCQEFMDYKRGIFDHNNCLAKAAQDRIGGHAVLIVGYGTENGVDFWTIKNSWGPSKGENGFYRMRRGKNLCGIADWPAFPIL